MYVTVMVGVDSTRGLDFGGGNLSSRRCVWSSASARFEVRPRKQRGVCVCVFVVFFSARSLSARRFVEDTFVLWVVVISFFFVFFFFFFFVVVEKELTRCVFFFSRRWRGRRGTGRRGGGRGCPSSRRWDGVGAKGRWRGEGGGKDRLLRRRHRRRRRRRRRR